MSSLLLFAVAGAFCLLLGLWSSVPAETNSFTQVMYYNNTSQVAGNGTDHIDTVALWDRQQILVLAKHDGDVKHYSEMSRLLNAVIEGNASSEASWGALSQMAPEGKEPVRAFVIGGATARFMNPDVTVTFTNDQGPMNSIVGKTILKGVKTTSGMHIISAEITIFRADELHERGELLPAVLHEFGHALGLQHSTSEEGIMYPMMTYRDDGAPNERVGECEFAGLRSLYVDSVIQQVEC